MAVDYNLVILGGSLAARYAAAFARCFHARVALIEPYSFQTSYAGIDLDGAIAQQLQAIAQRRAIAALHQCNTPADTPEDTAFSASPHPSPSAPVLLGESYPPTEHPPLAQLLRECSLDALTAQGVDVVIGHGDCETGEFCRRPHFGVVVNGRLLRSHAYLLAPASRPMIPSISGVPDVAHLDVPYLTVETLWGRSLPSTSRIAILGEPSRSIELAQALATSGMAVTVLMEHPRFLHHEDWDSAQWILAKLEALGVDVITGARVPHVKSVDGTVTIGLAQQSVVADYLLLATPRQAELSTLNLEAAHVRCVDGWVTVAPTLRTTHARIYACGEAIAPLSNPSTAREQVEIAVKNALFCATRRWGDRPHTSMFRTVPPCGRVGLTADQANHRFNRKVMKLTVPLHTEQPGVTDNPMWMTQEASFLSVLVHHRGAIVGAQCVGETAEELLAVFSVAIDQRWSVERLSSSHRSGLLRSNVHTSGLCADVLQRLLLKWQAESVNINPMKRNVLELLMNWQRDWSRG